MNRLLLLRPVSRAIRVKGSGQCSRTISRAFSSTPCQNIRATTPVTKSKKKRMEVVDADFFGGELEGRKEAESPELPAQELRSSVVHSAGKQAKTEQAKTKPAPVPCEHEERAEDNELDGISEISTKIPISTEPIDIEEYYGSWFSYETDVALRGHGLDKYAFVSAILETPFCQTLIENFDPAAEEEFEKRWLAFEMSEKDDDTGVIPVLEFFLRGGLQLLPPTSAPLGTSELFRFVEPSVAQKSLNSAPEGEWQSKGRKVKDFISEPIKFPDLLTPDRLLDPRQVLDLEGTKFANQVIIRNDRSVFHTYEDDESSPLRDIDSQEDFASITSSKLPKRVYQSTYQSILMSRRVQLQTGKGKIRRLSYMVLAGNGEGLVGLGEGKHSNRDVALLAARAAAVKNMDWVERFEDRTIWTEMRTKFGATQLILRPRPVGFGLRCNPFLHQIFRAAGLKDISAKVWGSRNKLNVIKAAFRMLQAGHAPTGMGDGVGGKGKKMSRGRGVIGKQEVERARGRKLITLRH